MGGGRHPLDLEVTPSVLLAARQAVYPELDRIFQFRLKGESEAQFAAYAESYLLHQLRLSLPTLKFYRELHGGEPVSPLFQSPEDPFAE